jgi:transposase-like protein
VVDLRGYDASFGDYLLYNNLAQEHTTSSGWHMNLIDVSKQFGTKEACNDFLEKLRWPEGVACIHCAGKNVSRYVKQASTCQRFSAKTGQMGTRSVPARILYVCRDCKKQFSVIAGTIFDHTHLPLEKWYTAVALIVNAKKGVSAKQIQRDLGTPYRTAWYLSHRIRKAMGVELGYEKPSSSSNRPLRDAGE